MESTRIYICDKRWAKHWIIDSIHLLIFSHFLFFHSIWIRCGSVFVCFRRPLLLLMLSWLESYIQMKYSHIFDTWTAVFFSPSRPPPLSLSLVEIYLTHRHFKWNSGYSVSLYTIYRKTNMRMWILFMPFIFIRWSAARASTLLWVLWCCVYLQPIILLNFSL